MAILNRKVVDKTDDEKRLIENGSLSSKRGRDYVNNKALYDEFVLYKKECADAEKNGQPRPKMSDTIGKAIIQICNRRCNSYIFARYTDNWREEMIDHAIMTCACKAHNFDVTIPTKNPFAYITSIANNAIIERINSEKRDLYIKHKAFDSTRGMSADMSDENVDDGDVMHFNETDDMYTDRLKYIDEFERKAEAKRKKNADKRPKVEVPNILDLLEIDL